MSTNGDRSGDRFPGGAATRHTVAQAAGIMGITAEAVRQRLKRGTLPHEKVGGTVYVLLEERSHDRPRPDDRRDADGTGDRTELVEVLKEEIAHLRRESERKDTIIMSLSQSNADMARMVQAIEAPASSPWTPHASEAGDEPPIGARLAKLPSSRRAAPRVPGGAVSSTSRAARSHPPRRTGIPVRRQLR